MPFHPQRVLKEMRNREKEKDILERYEKREKREEKKWRKKKNSLMMKPKKRER